MILFAKNPSYKGRLNQLYREISPKPYKFLDYYEFNEPLLNFLDDLKKKFKLVIFTTGIVQNDPVVIQRLGDIFSNIYSGKDMNIVKTDPTAYQLVLEKLGVGADEVVFIDDTQKNVEAAKAIGIEAIQYIDNSQIMRELGRLIP